MCVRGGRGGVCVCVCGFVYKFPCRGQQTYLPGKKHNLLKICCQSYQEIHVSPFKHQYNSILLQKLNYFHAMILHDSPFHLLAHCL